jgi:hypothetical protein
MNRSLVFLSFVDAPISKALVLCVFSLIVRVNGSHRLLLMKRSKIMSIQLPNLNANAEARYAYSEGGEERERGSEVSN